MAEQHMNIEALKGIGPKTAEKLKKAGINTPGDLLRHFPTDYELMEPVGPMEDARPGRFITVRGVVQGALRQRGFGSQSLISFDISDGTGRIRVSYFHMPYIKNQIGPGSERIFRGILRDGGKYGLSLIQPRMYQTEEYDALEGRIRALYALPAGVTESRLTGALEQALQVLEPREILPDWLLPPDTPGFREALRQIHFPESRKALEAARGRLVFEEFFLFLLGIRRLRQQDLLEPNSCPIQEGALVERALSGLPFELTEAQKRSFQEILEDLSGPGRMNRLLQGDVGSGKTAVALLALLAALDSGFQGALMAPTEILAQQHYQKISRLLEDWGLPIKAVLLTGSLKEAEKKRLRQEIAAGEARLIIGTHALIQAGVEYKNLGLVITDEQHRFGVHQRENLAGKGQRPHVLVMSATPIPRTLAIILYGDLQISLLDELPGGRQPIQSALISPRGRASAYRLILKEIRAGRRAYIVCPFIEASESLSGENVTDYTARLRSLFPQDIAIGMLHGRMSPGEKTRVMEDFASGRIQLLVSTTVVEVGVDVPQATVMMVENAERFGLAQLHQLRGRVGRGEAASYAIFVDGSGRKEKNRRLEILCESQDGFKIAEEDLKLRGPGDLLGVRQSGDLHFVLGDIYRDQALLHRAAAAADALLQRDPALQEPAHEALRAALHDMDVWKEKTL